MERGRGRGEGEGGGSSGERVRERGGERREEGMIANRLYTHT